MQGTKNSQNNLEKEQTWRVHPSQLQKLPQTTTIKTLRCWHQVRHSLAGQL